MPSLVTLVDVHEQHALGLYCAGRNRWREADVGRLILSETANVKKICESFAERRDAGRRVFSIEKQHLGTLKKTYESASCQTACGNLGPTS